jgi:hypothetical protein
LINQRVQLFLFKSEIAAQGITLTKAIPEINTLKKDILPIVEIIGCQNEKEIPS